MWRGPVVAGRLAKLEFSIQAKEDFSASIGARVEAAEMPTNYYILPVRTISVGTLQVRVANLTDFVRVQTNAGPPHITQTAAGGGGYSPLSAGGYITVRGTFVYQVDLTGYCPGKITPPYGSGNYCPMRRVEVVLYDGETWPLSPREISRTTTDDNGNYIFAGVSNDDGWLGGGLDTYVEVLSTDLKAAYDLSTHVALTKPSSGAGYAADTPQVNDVPDGSTVDYGIRYPTQNNEAWESIDAVLREYDWVRSNSGTGWTRGQIDVWWPYGTWPQFVYSGPTNQIWLNDRSANYVWNHYTLYHEYGHAVMFTAYGNSLPNGAGPPPSDPCYPGHCIFSETSGQYAIVEGFAEFMEAAVDNTPESVQGYYNGHGGNLEVNDWYNCVDIGDTDGNAVEGSVASVFWDIFDPANDDSLSLGFGPVWSVLVNSHPQQLYPDFWNAWFQRYDYSTEMTQTFVNYGVLASTTITVTRTLTQSSTSYSYRTTTTTSTSYTSTTTSTSTIPTVTTVVLVPLTITSTEQSTQFLTPVVTTTTTSYTSTTTSTSTIPTTIALVPLTVTSIVQSIQYLTSILSTTVTNYISTETSTSTVVVPTTVVLVPLTATSTEQSTQYLTSTATTTVTSYTDTQTVTSTIPAVTTVVLLPSTVTSTIQATQYLTSVLTTIVTNYTSTTTSTSTSVVYTTVTVSQGAAGGAGSIPLTYFSFLSLLAITVGHKVVASRPKKTSKVRSAILPPKLTARFTPHRS